MAEAYYQPHPSEFICVDAYPDSMNVSSAGNDDGNLLYQTETEGPPQTTNSEGYVHDREVNCAVCSSNSIAKETFTHWGKNNCGGNSAVRQVLTLYQGWMGGGFYSQEGSATNYLCMYDPAEVYGNTFNDGNQDGALLYRTEYQTGGRGIAPLIGMHDRDAACAVCEVNSDDVIMIPGPITCPSGYDLLYSGWIAANFFNHPKPHQYICVDIAPEAFPGDSAGDQNGALLYPTETEGPGGPLGAGVLANYISNRELFCAVCAAQTPKTANFVRWGRNSCTGVTGATALYTGWAGAGRFDYAGSGANLLCLHPSPAWPAGYFSNGNEDGALIFPSEYNTANFGVPSLRPLHGHEIGCTVCTVPAQSVQMIPGKRTCPTGLNFLYEGYLMASHYTHLYANQWVCVDANAEPMVGSNSGFNNFNNQMFPTETEGPPGAGYVHNREVTCVVCSL